MSAAALATVLPKAFADVADSQDVSLALVHAICAHCVALSDVRRLVRENSRMAGQGLSARAVDAFPRAAELEQRLRTSLIGFQARNAAEERDRATYLQGIF
ncbi:hypothetical protein X768_16635 [Mesorhizobium sp. LSJC265A00]|nr:hypothetical protein X768_16635 [Mesorhizobium sp. LSJC265A00]